MPLITNTHDALEGLQRAVDHVATETDELQDEIDAIPGAAEIDTINLDLVAIHAELDPIPADLVAIHAELDAIPADPFVGQPGWDAVKNAFNIGHPGAPGGNAVSYRSLTASTFIYGFTGYMTAGEAVGLPANTKMVGEIVFYQVQPEDGVKTCVATLRTTDNHSYVASCTDNTWSDWELQGPTAVAWRQVIGASTSGVKFDPDNDNTGSTGYGISYQYTLNSPNGSGDLTARIATMQVRTNSSDFETGFTVIMFGAPTYDATNNRTAFTVLVKRVDGTQTDGGWGNNDIAINTIVI